MCLYYKEKTGLTYSGQEHIVPAAIGGKTMLPKGYVSDQFNNDISKLEQDFLRESLVAMPRFMLGPGKRGSHSPSKATKSKVHLITDVENDNMFALGYTSLGQTCEIPNVVFNASTGHLTFSMSKTPSATKQVIEKFKEQCANAQLLKIKTVIANQLSEDIIAFAIHDNIEENFNCFIFKNENNKHTFDKETIKLIGRSLQQTASSNQTYMPRGHLDARFKTDYYRVYAKIAFNFLAQIKGDGFVKHQQFDTVRNYIAFGGNYPLIKINNGDEPLKKMGIEVPEDAHTVYISRSLNELWAQVYLYGGLSVAMILTKDCSRDIGTDIFICDWKNSKEYNMLQWMQHKNYL